MLTAVSEGHNSMGYARGSQPILACDPILTSQFFGDPIDIIIYIYIFFY